MHAMEPWLQFAQPAVPLIETLVPCRVGVTGCVPATHARRDFSPAIEHNEAQHAQQ